MLRLLIIFLFFYFLGFIVYGSIDFLSNQKSKNIKDAIIFSTNQFINFHFKLIKLTIEKIIGSNKK